MVSTGGTSAPSQVMEMLRTQNQRPLKCLNNVDMLLGEKNGFPSSEVQGSALLHVRPPSFDMENDLWLGRW